MAALARSADTDPRMVQWLPYARRAAIKYTSRWPARSYAEWYGVALEALWQATLTHNPEIAQFSTWAVNQVNWAMRKESSKLRVEHRRFGRMVRLDQESDDAPPFVLASQTPPPDAGLGHDKLHRALAMLPRRSRELIKAVYFDESAPNSRAHGQLTPFGVTRQRLSQLQAESFRFLREALAHSGELTELRPPRGRVNAKRRPKTGEHVDTGRLAVIRAAEQDKEAVVIERAQVRIAAAELGRRGGLVGGRVRAANMTPEERSESARRAANKRWSARTQKD